MKLLEENIKEMVNNIELGKAFLDLILEAWATLAKLDKQDYIKLKAPA